jgi:hypothetical protein
MSEITDVSMVGTNRTSKLRKCKPLETNVKSREYDRGFRNGMLFGSILTMVVGLFTVYVAILVIGV